MARGGRREGAGRPRSNAEPPVPLSVYVPASLHRDMVLLAGQASQSVSALARDILVRTVGRRLAKLKREEDRGQENDSE